MLAPLPVAQGESAQEAAHLGLGYLLNFNFFEELFKMSWADEELFISFHQKVTLSTFHL